MNVQTPAKSLCVTVAHPTSALTLCLYATAVSAMHVEYSSTVAVHGDGSAPHFEFVVVACRQVASCVAQFCCKSASVGALLDTPYVSPDALQTNDRGMARP